MKIIITRLQLADLVGFYSVFACCFGRTVKRGHFKDSRAQAEDNNWKMRMSLSEDANVAIFLSAPCVKEVIRCKILPVTVHGSVCSFCVRLCCGPARCACQRCLVTVHLTR